MVYSEHKKWGRKIDSTDGYDAFNMGELWLLFKTTVSKKSRTEMVWKSWRSGRTDPNSVNSISKNPLTYPGQSPGTHSLWNLQYTVENRSSLWREGELFGFNSQGREGCRTTPRGSRQTDQIAVRQGQNSRKACLGFAWPETTQNWPQEENWGWRAEEIISGQKRSWFHQVGKSKGWRIRSSFAN